MEPLEIQPGGCTSPDPRTREDRPELNAAAGREVSSGHIAAGALVWSIIGILLQAGGFTVGAIICGLVGVSVGAALAYGFARTMPGIVGFIAMSASATSLVIVVARVIWGR